jgi:protein SCO1/2
MLEHLAGFDKTAMTLTQLSWGRTLAIVLPLITVFPRPAWGHNDTNSPAGDDVRFDQRLNEQVPLGLVFRDETGKTVHLAEYFGQKPVILTLVYYKCKDVCPLLLEGVVKALRELPFDVGKQFTVVTVSFDAHDRPALATAKKKDVLSQYPRAKASAGWHFLVGDESSIRRLTQSVGFRYSSDSRTGSFAHATGMVLLTPQGKTSRYFYGIEFSPRDLRLGLIEAAANK